MLKSGQWIDCGANEKIEHLDAIEHEARGLMNGDRARICSRIRHLSCMQLQGFEFRFSEEAIRDIAMQVNSRPEDTCRMGSQAHALFALEEGVVGG
jgi:hypothetical protein